MNNLTSRELFKSWARNLDLPITNPFYGKLFDKTKPFKNWYDAVAGTSYIGKYSILSPQGIEVQVNYLKGFVEYPYAVQQQENEFIVDRLIMLRDEAAMLNVVRGDEGTAFTEITSPTFSNSNIIWDQPLADNEIIKRVGIGSIPMIISESEVLPTDDLDLEVLKSLKDISAKLDILLNKK